jgi:hypothetical protein
MNSAIIFSAARFLLEGAANAQSTSLATPYNDLAIPTIMGPTFLITAGCAVPLFTLFFIAEVFRLQMTGVMAAADPNAKKPAMSAFIMRSFSILICGFCLYSWVFLRMVSTCDYIFNAVDNSASWESFTSLLNSGATGVSITNLSMQQVIYATCGTILSMLDGLVFTMRFVILSLLYLLGPIAWVFAVSEIGTSSIKAWFRTTWEVSFWIVVYGVIKAAVTPLGMYAWAQIQTSSAASTNSTTYLTALSCVLMVTIIFCVMEIPKFTGILFSGAHISAVSNAFVGATAGFIAGKGYTALSGLAKGAAASYAATKATYASRINALATLTPGKASGNAAAAGGVSTSSAGAGGAGPDGALPRGGGSTPARTV